MALFRIISQSLLCIFMLDSAIFYSVKMIESFILHCLAYSQEDCNQSMGVQLDAHVCI